MIFPTFDDLDDDLLKEWEENLRSSSFCMMHILIKNAERKLEKLKGQIADLEKEIRDMNLPDLENNYAILKGVISKHQLQIKDKKLSKIRRDERDYKQGRVFTFGKGFDEVQKPKVTGGVEVQGELSSVNYSSSGLSSSEEQGTTNTVELRPTTSSFSEEIQRIRRGKKKIASEQGGVGGGTESIRIVTRSQNKLRK